MIEHWLLNDIVFYFTLKKIQGGGYGHGHGHGHGHGYGHGHGHGHGHGKISNIFF